MGYLSKLTLTFKNVWVDVSVWAEVWFGLFCFFHSSAPIPRRDGIKRGILSTHRPNYLREIIKKSPFLHLYLTDAHEQQPITPRNPAAPTATPDEKEERKQIY